MNDLRLPLLFTGLLGVAVSVRIAAWPLVAIDLPSPTVDSSRAVLTKAPSRIPSESISAVVARDPFRVGRRPLLPAYDPLRIAEQLAPAPPRPALVLVGILDGSAPSAVIEGMPGVDGARVVRVGDVIGGLRVKTISGGRVVIIGMDTTWVLGVRLPWQP